MATAEPSPANPTPAVLDDSGSEVETKAGELVRVKGVAAVKPADDSEHVLALRSELDGLRQELAKAVTQTTTGEDTTAGASRSPTRVQCDPPARASTVTTCKLAALSVVQARVGRR